MRRTIAGRMAAVGALLAAVLFTGASTTDAVLTCWGQVPTIIGATGTNGADVLEGNIGVADIIDGLAGADDVCGDDHDMAISGGQGPDRVEVRPGGGLGVPDVVGDGGSAIAAGQDRVVVRAGASTDLVFGDGGPYGGAADTILVAGKASVLAGDAATQGAPDFIAVLPAGDVITVIGDFPLGGGFLPMGGRDTITIVGRANTVVGDAALQGGNDTIAITNGAQLTAGAATPPLAGSLMGDLALDIGGHDFMIIRGTIENTVYGDWMAATSDPANRGDGGNDFLRIYPAATIGGHVVGDGGGVDAGLAVETDYAPGTGGNDTIVAWPGASLGGSVYGDATVGDGGNDRFSLGATVDGFVIGDATQGDGGDDSIGIGGAATVISVFGDGADGNGGHDIIDVSGRVTALISGDDAANGGNDTIFIRSTAIVGSVYGDGVASAGGDDRIVVNRGATTGLITGDLGNTGGDDTIIVSGTVNGPINADQVGGLGGDDAITINPAGVVNGDIIADKGTNTITIHGTVNGDITCSPTTTLEIKPGAVITGDTSTC